MKQGSKGNLQRTYFRLTWTIVGVAGWLWLAAEPILAQRPAVVRAPIAAMPVANQAQPPTYGPVAPPENVAAPPGAMDMAQAPTPVPELPADFAPWWQADVLQQLRESSSPLSMSLDNVVLGTLMHSPQVRVLSDAPVIRSTSIMEAQGKFDLHTFAEGKFVNTSDPVGSTLTTGGANRFLDQNMYASAGIRRQLTSGAQFEASQKIGYQDNNSIYFVPTQQGTARMTFTLTQPLLNGRGKAYNNSLIVLAEINTSIAQDELSKQLQDLLLQVYETYWDLYLQRATLLQRRKLWQDAVNIRDELNGRRNVDVLGNQLVRAQAAVSSREAAVIRFQTSVRNSEARLRALVNDPSLALGEMLELVPSQTPNQAYLPIRLEDSLIEALKARPEVNQAAKELRAASLRVCVSKNELLPMLNLVLGTYVYGLQGQSNIAAAYGNQFSVGRPTYSAGLLFDVPYENRAARARYQARRVEVRQLANQLEVTMTKIRAEVEVAAREVDTTYREMVSKYHAMKADQAEINYLTERWRLLPGDQQVAGVVLDDLLTAQERLADAEFGFARSLVAYNVSLVNLRKTTGTLLAYDEITQMEGCQDGLPTLMLGKNTTQRELPPQPPMQGLPVQDPSLPPGAYPAQPMQQTPPPGAYPSQPVQQNLPPPNWRETAAPQPVAPVAGVPVQRLPEVR